MKKILLLALVFGSFKSFGQYPVKQHIGGDSTEIWGTTFWGKKGLVNGIYADTTSANLSRISQYPYAQIATDSTLWMRNSSATAWLRIASGSTGGPTIIYVKDDLTVDTITNPGFQTLGRLHSDGLVSGGLFTSEGCLSIHVTSPSYYLNNGTHYIAPAITLTFAAPDVFTRTDRIVADTLGNIYILRGDATGIAPQINPASQLSLGILTIDGGSSCLSISSIVIYDETGGTEYTPSDAGTITADPVNTDNPEHLVKDYFISSYADSGQIIFTKPSGQDTVFNNSVFRWGQYVNGRFNNQLQMQLYLGGVPVTGNISVNPYFDVLDSGVYYVVAVPWFAFSTPGNIIFDKIVYTLAGNDLSGALGFYMDWLQLQTGITNNPPIPPYRFGIEDITGEQNRLMDMEQYNFTINNANKFQLALNSFKGQIYVDTNTVVHETLRGGFESVNKWSSPTIPPYAQMFISDTLSTAKHFILYADSAVLTKNDPTLGIVGRQKFPDIAGNFYIPLTVNGNLANSSGEITVATGGTGTVTSIGLTSSDITIGGTASPITTSGTYTLTLPTVNSNVGTFTNATVTVNAKGQITAASTGASGGTTADSTLTATGGQTAFTFSSVPASPSDYEVHVNGIKWDYTTGFTTAGNVITLTTAMVAGDLVNYSRKK